MPKESAKAQDVANCTLGLYGRYRNPIYCVGCDCDTCGWDRNESKRRRALFSNRDAFPPDTGKNIRHLKLY